MEQNQAGSSKKSIIVSVIILVLVAGAFFYYLKIRDKQVPSENLGGGLENSQGVGSAVPPSANPLLLTTPEATPVEKTNPFKYENPFE